MKLKALLAVAATTTVGVAMATDYTGTAYEPWTYSAGCVVWRATSGQLFHASTVADVGVDEGNIKIGDTYTFGTSGHPWQVFAKNQSAYTAPGKVLVFDEAGYNNNSDAQFAPFSFGGLWVKALQAEGVPYCITDNQDGTSGKNADRKVELGATGASTYFKFDESFTFDRNSATKVLGTATVEIADGKTFTINQRANKGALVESGNTLVLKGAGTLAVVAGLKVDGTLDLSAEAVPTIDGDVALNGTIVLPADVELPFTVCSGTLSGLNVTVKIGDEEAVEKSMTISGGAITAFGDPIYVFTENYPTVVPAGKTYTFIGGDTAENTVVVDALDVRGTLKTQGYFSFTNYKSNGSTLDVESGSLTLNPGNNWFNGTLTVEAGATFVNALEADAVQYNGSFTANIYGTLDMGATRWSLGANNTLNFHEGCTVTGSGSNSGNSTLDWIENAEATLNVYGTVNLEAPIRIRGTATVNVNVDAGANDGLTLAGTIGVGKIVKKGAGLVKFTTNPPYAITVENGAFTFAVDATPTITYSAKPGTGTSMSMWYATQDTWKGTVVLETLAAPTALPLENYGNANSKIVLKGTTGSTYLNNNATINAEVVIDGAVEFNNGSSDKTYTFKKVSGTNSDSTLTFKFWTGCSKANWVIDELNEFAGTIVLPNESTHSSAGDKHKFTVNNIVKAGATAGTQLVKLSQPAPTTSGNYNAITVTKVNGEDAKVAVTATGIYVAAASASIGGVVTYYRGAQTAFTTVNANGSAGDSVTILDGNDYGEVEGFEYNSETKTYTMLQMVAQFTSGMMTHKYTTIAGACTDAEKLDPVPTVVLLVELGEQTVPSGWEYNDPETSGTTYGTLTKVEASDTYEITGETVLDEGSFTVPAGTTTITLGAYDVTAGFTIDGTTATLVAPEVVEDEDEAIAIGEDTVTLNVDLVPGLYYGVGASEDLTITKPTMTQYTGSNGAAILTVDKPSEEKGFFKVFVDIKE